MGEADFPSPSLKSLSFPLSFILPSSPTRLKVGPLNPAKGSGGLEEYCKLSQWGLGPAPAKIEFGAS